MNKKNIIKIILCSLSLIFMISFYISTNEFSPIYLISLLFLGTVYMYKFKDKINRYKFIYDVILMILMFFSSILFIWIMINIISSLKNIIFESPSILNIFNLYFILKILIDSFINLESEKNKMNDYMVIIVLTIINFIFIRYYLDICVVIVDEIMQIEFMNQNYIYFFVMLITIHLHKYITTKLQ